ncbi:IS110 family transposase [Marinobacter salexigens]|uniref:Transposase n=1 Tax=Marinobacter salexigens TaxID=1925763 RepID=A0ABS6A390_9GAMM|nr:transposase [Marinobacter salexigens]MBU2872553.1 transposase [Marinobacter salexigens]
MTDQNKTHSDTVIVALDIAKKSHDAVVLMPSGKRFYTKVANSHEGYQQLLARTGVGPDQVKVGFEPTADYHRNIAYWLAEAGCQCFLVSSLVSNRAREMHYQTWDKNDRKDARVILYLMEQNIMEPFHDPLRSGVVDVQELSNTYHQISMARTRIMNSLFNHYVSLYFPDIERFFNSTRSEWFCRFMLKYPTPASVTRYKLETFIKRAWEVVGRKVSKTRLLTGLYDAASNSIGIPVDANSVAVETFKLQVQRFYDLTLQRTELEGKADQFLSEREDYHHLRSIPGIGPIVAMIILAESGDLRRFKHYRQQPHAPSGGISPMATEVNLQILSGISWPLRANPLSYSKPMPLQRKNPHSPTSEHKL